MTQAGGWTPIGAVRSAPVALAIDGRPLGRRAQATRRRLLDATAELLESQGVRDVRVVDIARRVGTSPATFYQYFRDVGEAVLVLAEEVGDELHPLAEVLDGPWAGRAGLEPARRLVDGFVDYWDRNRAVLRVRNLAAQEGDRRFREVRVHALSTITDRLEARIAESQATGRVAPEITPYAAAAALVAMMERMAAYHFDLEPRGVARPEIVETVARIIHQTVLGRRP
jgi:AcrR family transcriptional regulator